MNENLMCISILLLCLVIGGCLNCNSLRRIADTLDRAYPAQEAKP